MTKSMRRTYIRNQTQPKKKYLTKYTSCWIVFGILVAIQIFCTIQASTMGAELSAIEHTSMALTKGNQELKGQLVSRSSLTDAQEQIETLGYVKPKDVLFVKNNAPVTALR